MRPWYLYLLYALWQPTSSREADLQRQLADVHRSYRMQVEQLEDKVHVLASQAEVLGMVIEQLRRQVEKNTELAMMPWRPPLSVERARMPMNGRE